jgi:DNA-directed RNA polymerase specialized sigma24 family protein
MKPDWHVTKKEEIVDWYLRGYPLKEISKLVGASVTKVRSIIKAFLRKSENPW